ncbi:arylamine N-acetyltransferase family protein [Arhodomonas sp. AD133]|uniref:arylamine N-acetyltransferase family protein n=1 Tax=Arhodomonas sp. AD133 TaxID=3415009 RepID=UPI003EBBDFCB
MSASSTETQDVAGARMLVLGRRPEVMETVLDELNELGIAAHGSTDPDNAPAAYDASAFDLIALGGGLSGAPGRRLKAQFTRQHPEAQFLDTFAPRAVHEIVAALSGASQTPQVDLDAYCARIGYDGPREPTLATLHALQALHPAAIPFEAVDVLLDRGIDLSPTAVDAKLIGAGRGGYCFEHNGLLKRVLTAMGFHVEGLLARVRWLAPAGTSPGPRTHMALRVTVDDVPWLVDVGFGACVPTAPLRMDTTSPQPTQHETFRVIPFGHDIMVQARVNDRWRPMYQLSPEAQLDEDYEPANWYTSQHPSSHFRDTLMVARTTPTARFTLQQGKFTMRRPDGRVERAILDADGIEDVLHETFGLPVERGWRAVIEGAAAAQARSAATTTVSEGRSVGATE